MVCQFTIDKEVFEFDVEGHFFKGSDAVLFQEKDNVLENCEWLNEGFRVAEVFSSTEFEALKRNIQSIVRRILTENGIHVDASFTLEQYHKYVVTDEAHQSVISKTRFLTFRDFHIDMEKLVNVFSNVVGKKLQRENPLLAEEIVIMRINRPSSLDINPFHRDGYLDIWKDVLNAWIPVSGCGLESSLPVIPGSHFWNEQDIVRTEAKGASINGQSYHVPAILSYKNGMHAIRPNPPYGSALIFTPFLVHGGAINRQKDITRIALELRLFFDKKQAC